MEEYNIEKGFTVTSGNDFVEIKESIAAESPT